MNVSEPRGLDTLPLDLVFHNRHGPPQLFPPLGEELAKLPHGRLLGDGPIVAAELCRGLMALDPPARLQRGKGLTVQCVPVDDAAEEPPDMDEIERVRRKSPWQGAVVDFAVMLT